MPLSFLFAAALSAAAPLAATAPMPTGDALTTAIADHDARLFWAAFEGCEPQALNGLLTPEFRMVHDKGGLTLASRAAFVERMERQCAARKTGGDHAGYKNRRQIVPGSRIVRSMGDWGALEEASHVFFEWNAKDARWDMVGGARYMHVWQWMPAEGRFRLSESLSYDHAGAAPYPPPVVSAPAR